MNGRFLRREVLEILLALARPPEAAFRDAFGGSFRIRRADAGGAAGSAS